MTVRPFWMSVVAALALAAPMAAGRSEQDEATAQQQPANLSPTAGFTSDQLAGDTVRQPAAVEQPAAQAEPQPPKAEEQMATPAAPVAPAPDTAPAEPAAAPAELPRTASPLALLALFGLGSAGSAAGLRRFRRR